MKSSNEAKKQLLQRVRCRALVRENDVCDAYVLGLDVSLLWAAAGAGLAMIHRRVGIAPNIEELRGDFPDDYLRGYYYEQTAHQIEVAQGVA
ncbi:MAG: hypothetical protein J6T08_08375 [Lentisphaeria bacterium]|nr:hypothetical protein [Lentisphaeria bacterium]